MCTRNIGRIAAALLLATTVAQDAQSQPPPARRLAWSVVVADAESLAPAPRSYRLFQTTDRIVLVLTLTNDSLETMLVDADVLSDAVGLRVAGQTALAVDVKWDPAIRRSGTPSVPGKGLQAMPSGQDRIQLEPRTGFSRRAFVSLTSGEAWQPGTYTIDLDMAAALRTVRDAGGALMSPMGVPNTTLHVAIAPPADARERAAMHRVAALAAMDENRHADAAAAFARALAATPEDPDLQAGLGTAYLGLNRYGEAIAAYERALPALRKTENTGVPQLLALAYIGAGDEPNAIRVLRAYGKSEAEIPGRIRALRDQISKRAIR